MTTIKIKVDPAQTPEEEMQLVAHVAAAVAESTGAETVNFELERSEHMIVAGDVARRMGLGVRWGS